MIETKKLSDLTLKRITKSDNTFEDVHITDVPTNIISNGTNITDNTLDNINYKDNQSLEFNKLINNNMPTPESGKCLIYSTTDGKLYCAISGYNPFEISQVTASDIIKKKGVTYVNNGSLDYFNLNNGMRLFSNSTKIGATPTRTTETNNILDAAYFDITDDEIKAIINNNTKIDITNDNIKLKQNDNSKIELLYDRFILTGKQTEVGIDSTKTTFNCDTSLNKVVYGNNKYKIEITNEIEIKNNQNNNTIIKINQNGEIYLGDKSLEDYIKELASKEVRRHKEMIRIFNGSSKYIDSYFYYDNNYVFYFSDTANSNILMSIEINGLDIEDMSPIYIPKTNSYYYLDQYVASGIDGDDTDTIRIYKVNNGNHSQVYFREVYKEHI